MDYRMLYDYRVIQSHEIIKFTMLQRIKRAWKYKSFKMLNVKEIKVMKYPVGIVNTNA